MADIKKEDPMIKKAKAAKKYWNAFKAANPNEKFSENFHIRVNASYYTIVSGSDEGYYMNGIDGLSLKALKEHVERLNSEALAGKISFEGFGKRGSGKTFEEAQCQCEMINGMSKSEALLNCLGLSSLRFIASELTLWRKADANDPEIQKVNAEAEKQNPKYSKKRIIDLIAMGKTKEGNNVLIALEVKKPGEPYNKVKNQVEDYIRYHNTPKKRDLMKAVLMNYPMCSAEDYEEVRFVIVSGHLGQIDKDDSDKSTDKYEIQTVVFK